MSNFVAFEPNQLTAAAFALAALGSETLGYFNLEGQWLWVVKYQVQPGDRTSDRFWVQELNSSSRRVLSHTVAGSQMPKQFYHWEPEAILHSGDTLVYIEVRDRVDIRSSQPATQFKQNLRQLWREISRSLVGKNLKQKISQPEALLSSRFRFLPLIPLSL